MLDKKKCRKEKQKKKKTKEKRNITVKRVHLNIRSNLLIVGTQMTYACHRKTLKTQT